MPEVMFRPPFEAASLLLEVTHGCSHNACAFCTMYRGVPFQLEPMERVEECVRTAAVRRPGVKRVFLEHGDAFALSAERLIRIAELIHAYLPRVEMIAMYASIKNIASKSDDDLERLREAGIGDLNVGVESGLDEALRWMNKGYTAAQARHELLRLKRAGIPWGANVILGAAGPALRSENAIATAELLSATQPNLIFTGTLHADPGCPLYEAIKSGAFAESTFGEYFDEEETLIEQLELDDCVFFGLHPSNVVTMEGRLPQDKDRLLAELRDERDYLRGRLDRRPVRASEGAIIGS
ncbi:MAG: radical SAM protein [Pyramidobacter sp.]|nr:radical SAM protein [Pyramidobacter sp.]